MVRYLGLLLERRKFEKDVSRIQQKMKVLGEGKSRRP
jgi:hypothetical protein